MKKGKILVAYFSVTNMTKKIAEIISTELKCDIYRIQPETNYKKEDLNWQDPKSRTQKEQKDKKARPKLLKLDARIKDYDTILLGFPIWWYIPPRIINTFLESYDFTNKNIVLWGTSHATDFGDSVISNLSNSCKGHLIQGVIFNKEHIKEDDVKKFVKLL